MNSGILFFHRSRKTTKLSLFVLTVLVFAGCNKYPQVSMETSLGNIILEIDTVSAPVTSRNFLKNVDNRVYDSAKFYRVVRMDNQPNNKVRIEVIQGGLADDSLINTFPVIRHENTTETGLKHLDGTLSMARNQPGSASTEFFICIGNQPELDFGGKRNPDGQGFSAFGRVIKGMEVVKKIQQLPDTSQYLTEPVKILKCQRLN